VILLILTSQVARIIDGSYWCMTEKKYFLNKGAEKVLANYFIHH
jgi:hypothetical protein